MEFVIQSAKIKGIIFDLDGTVYKDDVFVDGAHEIISQLQKTHRIAFLTNNSNQTSKDICKKLLSMGLSILPNKILTTTEVAGEYIYERYGKSNVYVVGSDQLKRSVAEHGHYICNDYSHCDCILVGRDLSFDFMKLRKSVNLLGRCQRLIACNMDYYHPGKNDTKEPETGALIAAITSIQDADIDVIGKPSTYLFDKALKLLNLDREQVLVVGDNLTTDVIGAKRAGMHVAWLNETGAKNKLDVVPDIVLEQLNHLVAVLVN